MTSYSISNYRMLDFANTSSVNLWKLLTNHFSARSLTPLEFSTTAKKLLKVILILYLVVVKNSRQNKFFIVFILLSLFYTDWTTTTS